MRPLKENYRIYTIMSICSPHKPLNQRMKCFRLFVTVVGPIILLTGTMASVIYVKEHLSVSLTEAISSSLVASAILTAIYAFFLAHIKRDDLKGLFENFQNFYDKCKCEHKTILIVLIRLFTSFFFLSYWT